MVLGQAISGNDDGIMLVCHRSQAIIRAILEVFGGWIALLLINGVEDRRLCRLVVSGEWSILQAFGHEEPASTIRFHDKGIAARNGIHTCRTDWWYVAGIFIDRKIG